MFGYSLKLQTVVSSIKGGLRKLSIPFSTPILNLPIKDLTVKVCLSPACQIAIPIQEAIRLSLTYSTSVPFLVMFAHTM